MRSLRTTTKSSPRSPQLEKSLRAAMKTHRSQKLNNFLKKESIPLIQLSSLLVLPIVMPH